MVPGNDHPDTLSTRHRLARMLGLQGRYAETTRNGLAELAARRPAAGG